MSPCRYSRIAIAGAAEFLALLACGPTWAQPADSSKADDSKTASSNTRNAPYPRLHPDLRATFRLKADGAQKVQVVIGRRRHDMAATRPATSPRSTW